MVVQFRKDRDTYTEAKEASEEEAKKEDGKAETWAWAEQYLDGIKNELGNHSKKEGAMKERPERCENEKKCEKDGVIFSPYFPHYLFIFTMLLATLSWQLLFFYKVSTAT